MTFGLGNGRMMALACALAAFALDSTGAAFAAPRAVELGPEVAMGSPPAAMSDG